MKNLITFETSGVAAGSRAVYDALIRMRQTIVDSPENRDHVIDLPEVQLADYAARRGASPLGQIFQAANGLHDHIDAVVVLGHCDAIRSVRAIVDACCHPYHNELSRGSRGSKPRVYFGGDRFDNDAASSLLDRVTRIGNDVSDAERRFAIIVIGHADQSRSTVAMLSLCIDRLRLNLGDETDVWLPRLVIPVMEPSDFLAEYVEPLGCKTTLSIPANTDPIRNILSPISLLPAAFLGLDCMKLLEGAALMNDHFWTAPTNQNTIIRFAAANQIGTNNRNQTGSSFVRPTSKHIALRSLIRWYQRLVDDRWDVDSNVDHQWSIEKGRSDPLIDPFSGTTFDHRLHTEVETSTGSDASPMRLTLPHLDTFVLGQVVQMLIRVRSLVPVASLVPVERGHFGDGSD